ncbi:MAG: VOC family protein [Gammaproteobacteria bacterium]
MAVLGIDHVQLAIPASGEERARAFYADLLGLVELAKPLSLAQRGGVWFQCGSQQLHLGVEEPFRPARKAHPALLVDNLGTILAKCRKTGIEVMQDEPLMGYARAFIHDPFGNRIELLQPT